MKLYHYTDASAVQSILLNQKLWLTDLRFMNDSSELLHGLEVLKAGLKTQPYGVFYDFKHAAAALDYVSSTLKAYEDAAQIEDPVFAMSFSKADDLLSQWRGYGSYSICICGESLINEGLRILPCTYDARSKKDRAEGELSDAGSRISQEMASNNGCIGIDSIDRANALIEVAATFKDAGFQEEREVRLIAHPGERDIRYRQRNGILIPYIEISIPREAILGVRVGPIRDQGIAALSMEMFLRSIERMHRNAGGSIEWCVPVLKSATPYRT